MKIVPSIHQFAVVTWINIVVSSGPRVSDLSAQGMVVVAVMISVVPLLLKWSYFRHWFCWTDAFSERQWKSLKQRNLRLFYQTGYDDGYISRVNPYLKRILIAAFVLLAIEVFVPNLIFGFDFKAVWLFAPLYPLSVFLLALASFPYMKKLLTSSKRRK